MGRRNPPDDVEITEAGRPRVPRPMPDEVDLKRCPHCNAEMGAGHYVCWNCSKDVRMGAQTEEEILDEYQLMVIDEELRLERRNLRFFAGLSLALLLLALVGVALEFRIGSIVLLVLLALWPGYAAWKAMRRMGRIRATHGL